MKFHLSILFSLILFAIDYCNGSKCDRDYADFLRATQAIGAVVTDLPGVATIANTVNFILNESLGDDGSCLLKEVGYRIEKYSAKVKAKQADLFLRGIAQSIRDKVGCNDNDTPERCIKSLKNDYTFLYRIRHDLKTNHHLYFESALEEDEFDDLALYAHFVKYGQLEFLVNDMMSDICGHNNTHSDGKIGTSNQTGSSFVVGESYIEGCNMDRYEENINSFKSFFKFFLRVGTDLYGYRTMSRFNDKSAGSVAKLMKRAGDKILRPWILILINRLKDKRYRSIMDIGGDEGTWNKNPEKFLENKEFWWDNFEIHYPYKRDTSKPSSFVPVPIRDGDWISLRCTVPFIPFATSHIGGRDSWLSCSGDTIGYDFDDYCEFRSCPGVMAGKGWDCGWELFQIQSIYISQTEIRSGYKIGLKYKSTYWLSRYKFKYGKGSGYEHAMPAQKF